VVTGSASVEPVAGEEVLQESSSVAVENSDHVKEGKEGCIKQKTDQVEDKDDEDKDDDDDDDDDEDENGNDASDYAPDEVGLEGTINLADDALTANNLLDKVEPGLKVSSPFDLPILPIAETLSVKKDKKGKKVNDGDEENINMLSDGESSLKKNKEKLVTKLPAAGSSSEVGTSKNSSEDVLMMIKEVQEEFLTFLGKVM